MSKFQLLISIAAVLISFVTSSCNAQETAVQTAVHSSTISKSSEPTAASTFIPTPSSLSVVVSMDIGAQFPNGEVQIKYVSFTPVITKSEAIAIAKKRLHDGFNWDTNNLPADATVALFSGHALPTSTRSATIVNDVQAWIVVVKDIPFIGSGGPPPLTPSTTSAFRAQPSWQFNLAIDATTGEDLDSVITSTPVQ